LEIEKISNISGVYNRLPIDSEFAMELVSAAVGNHQDAGGVWSVSFYPVGVAFEISSLIEILLSY